ncbi:CBL-interacting serine/threonine-protein kinase 24 [Camellia lanceoleosa]|uniref:CBL-interacting serine/threonine-protein kinase 24 n=1 Tax=Camellia lanceoleosa TaxID=1840588 RepID=A0ACC0FJA8_9ERIC|nr:CBL-interacting serine/threonine-protein kinase 24 [Camellia lanceoleosa]
MKKGGIYYIAKVNAAFSVNCNRYGPYWGEPLVLHNEQHVTEQSENNDSGPFIMNAFEMITLSQGLNLSALFDRRRTRLEGMSVNKIGQFAIVLEVFEVAPFLFMVDVRKATGDTNEYHKFYKNFCAKLEHIIWKPKDGPAKSSA